MSADLPHLVGALKAGDKAELDVVRAGERKTLQMTVGALPEEDQALAANAASGPALSNNRLGLVVVELTPEQKNALDLKNGVLVKNVLEGPAALMGGRVGDVITHLNNQAIESSKNFATVAKALPMNRSVSMRVLREGRASFITFKLTE